MPDVGRALCHNPAMKRLLAIPVFVVIAAVALAQGQGATHELPLLPRNIHWGYYAANIPPALRVKSGDRVRVETMVARGVERMKMAGATDAEIPASLKAVEAAITDRGPGAHPMTGPIYIDGAEDGDSIDVRLVTIGFLHNFGVGAFAPGGGVIPSEFPYAYLKLLRWPAGADSVEFAPGIHIKLAPFFGSIGVAPPVLSGRISSTAPGWHGGNLDNKDLIAGSVLTLPVHVPGALLSIGDGHAMQGDGEVTGTALETSLAATIEVTLRKGRRIRWPRAETPTAYMTMGLDPDLDEATRLAVSDMVAFLVAEKGLSREDAYVLCSLAGDLHVTQAVDQTKGVHFAIAKSVFK